MYQIDFTTCTADEVIDRSAACHPRLFAESLRDVALVHSRSAREIHDRAARESAEKMAEICVRLADRLVVSGHVRTEVLTFSERVQAFSIAARLQCVSPALAAEIIDR